MTGVAKDTMLSENFSLDAAQFSMVATLVNIDNTLSSATCTELDKRFNEKVSVLDNLKCVAEGVLEPLLHAFPEAGLQIVSWYRAPLLSIALGGGKRGDHRMGRAVDIRALHITTAQLAKWCSSNLEHYDQIVMEAYTPGDIFTGWVHVSVNPVEERNRHQLLNTDAAGTIYSGLRDC